MTEKRFVIKPSAMVDDCFVIIDDEKEYSFPILESTLNFMFCKALNDLSNENEQLKQENQLLKNKLDRIEDILPHFLSCSEISEFHGKTVKEDISLMKCWNKRYQK